MNDIKPNNHQCQMTLLKVTGTHFPNAHDGMPTTIYVKCEECGETKTYSRKRRNNE